MKKKIRDMNRDELDDMEYAVLIDTANFKRRLDLIKATFADGGPPCSADEYADLNFKIRRCGTTLQRIAKTRSRLKRDDRKSFESSFFDVVRGSVSKKAFDKMHKEATERFEKNDEAVVK